MHVFYDLACACFAVWTVKTLGKFEIIGKVGQGAMGVVYKAHDPFIDRIVAVKTVTAGVGENSNLLKRFYSEARSAGSLRHPNIVTIYELGHEGETPFIAMQFLNGESLDKLILRRPILPLSQKLGYIVQICRALDHAHQQVPPVIHRDIKPGNVMVTPEGCIVVVDFGIARLGDSTVSQSAGFLIGTLGYMSPQLFRGDAADAVSDIWSTGVLFYELLAYSRPFDGDSAAALMSKIVLENYRPILELAPDTPADVRAILERMLAKEVRDRYQSMAEVLSELEPAWRRLLQKDVSVLLESCEEYFRDGDLLAAQSEIIQIFIWDPSNPQARSLSDRISLELRRQNHAPLVKSGIEKAQRLLAEGRRGEARAEAEAVLKLDSACQPARDLLLLLDGPVTRNDDKEKQRLLKQRIREVERMIDRQQLTDAVDLARQSITTIGPDSGLSNALHKAEKEIEFREQKKRRQDDTIRLVRTLLGQAKLDDAHAVMTHSIENNLFSPVDPRVAQVLGEIEVKKRVVAEPAVTDFGRVPGTEAGKDYVYSREVSTRNAHAGKEEDFSKASPGGEAGKSDGELVHELQAHGGHATRTDTERLFLAAVERHLMTFLGPIAAIMVKRAAATSANPAALLFSLASTIPAEKDRKAFLARKDELLREFSDAQGAPESAKAAESSSTPLPSVGPPPSPAELSHATELLARRLGPLARILTERAAKRAPSLQSLYLLLAEHLGDKTERGQFLREAGFPQG